MATMRHILAEKGRTFYFVKPEATILDALTVLAERNIGAVLVMEGELLLGIFSERDFARKARERMSISLAESVVEMMTPHVVCVKNDTTVEDCMALMTEKRIRHVPVVEGKEVTGLVSIGDVVKVAIAERESVIHGLENSLVLHELPT